MQEKVAAARAALPGWRALGTDGRVAKMRRFHEVFSIHKEEFAKLATKEMGKPLSESVADLESALGYLGKYLDIAPGVLAPEVTYEGNGEVHTVYREPYGVAAVIVPWNYPASNFVWGACQALIAGNTVVFKSSEEVPMTSQMIERMMREAGMPEHVFTAVYGRGPVGALLSRQEIDLICFTGSTEVGKSLYRTAASKMIKIVMDLGGSAPGIVFEDADLDQATASIFSARFSNAGQMCDALKRLIVHEKVWDPLVERLVGRLGMVQLGDPMLPQFQMGPLVSQKQLEVIERQVDDAVKKGAIVMAGGKRPGLIGPYYEPTLLSQITAEMRVWREETFGPVLPLVRFSTEEEAVALANDTDYGLGAYVYSRDLPRAARVASQLQSGMVSINGADYSRPENPFGGMKKSGIGRAHGRWGFEDVTQAKIVARRK
jgi:succinate-semialdehyde dehydrogenase/glutarate-semialdehyde dehydrogenase